MADTRQCPRCGGDHGLVACPYVKAAEFDYTGQIVLKVWFLTPADLVPAKPDDATGDYPRLPASTRSGHG